jgi:hypothetical protein
VLKDSKALTVVNTNDTISFEFEIENFVVPMLSGPNTKEAISAIKKYENNHEHLRLDHHNELRPIQAE